MKTAAGLELKWLGPGSKASGKLFDLSGLGFFSYEMEIIICLKVLYSAALRLLVHKMQYDAVIKNRMLKSDTFRLKLHLDLLWIFYQITVL